jgi:hypothetical protein
MWWHTRETRFRLLAKQKSPFKLVGASVQSTTGSRVVRISGSNAGCTMFRGSVKSTGYPLQPPVSPSLPLTCVTVCHHISKGLHHLILQQLSGHVVARFKECCCTSFLKTCQCSSISLHVSYTSNPTTNKHNDGKTQNKNPTNLMSCNVTFFCPQKKPESFVLPRVKYLFYAYHLMC